MPFWLDITATTTKQRTNTTTPTLCRSASRHNHSQQRGPTTLDPIHNNSWRLKSKNHDTITITMVLKNARSLASDDRIQELIQELRELKDSRWDFVTINETWRRRKEELWITRQGRTFAATGNSKSCHGAPILNMKDRQNTSMKCNTLGHDSWESRSSGCKSRQFTSHTRDTETHKFSKCTLL